MVTLSKSDLAAVTGGAVAGYQIAGPIGGAIGAIIGPIALKAIKWISSQFKTFNNQFCHREQSSPYSFSGWIASAKRAQISNPQLKTFGLSSVQEQKVIELYAKFENRPREFSNQINLLINKRNGWKEPKAKNILNHYYMSQLSKGNLSSNYRKDLLIQIYNQTDHAIRHGFLLDGRLCKLDQDLLDKSFNESQMCNNIVTLNRGEHNTIIEVLDRDTFEQAEIMKKDGFNPLVLNMANARTPGGGVKNGASAQEESLCRRSTLLPALEKMAKDRHYPIKEYSAIYTPYVQVFRKSEKYGCEFQKPFDVACISTAAYNLGKIEMSPPDYKEGTKNKIRSILRVAKIKRHDSLVLGAFGCGAFRGDPAIVSKFFKEVLEEEEFKNNFRKISFAIIDDHNAIRGSNFEAFKKTLTK